MRCIRRHPMTHVSTCRWYTLTKLDGSALQFVQLVKKGGLRVLYDIWPRPSVEAWTYILGFGLLQALFQLFIPGPEFQGPITPKGNVPKYKVMPCHFQGECPEIPGSLSSP